MEAPDRPARRDRQPVGSDLAVEVRAARRQGHVSPASARRARTSANSSGSPTSSPSPHSTCRAPSGLDPGRYLGREPERVLVVGVEGQGPPPRRRLRRRRPTEADPERRGPEVPVTTLTVVRPEPLGDEEAAARWLESLRADPDAADGRGRRGAGADQPRGPRPSRDRARQPSAGREHRPGARGAGRLRHRRRARRRPLHGGARPAADRQPAPARRRPAPAGPDRGRARRARGGRRVRAAAAASPLRPRRQRLGEAALQLRIGLDALLHVRGDLDSAGQRDDLARSTSAASVATAAARRSTARSRRETRRRRDARDLRAGPERRGC